MNSYGALFLFYLYIHAYVYRIVYEVVLHPNHPPPHNSFESINRMFLHSVFFMYFLFLSYFLFIFSLNFLFFLCHFFFSARLISGDYLYFFLSFLKCFFACYFFNCLTHWPHMYIYDVEKIAKRTKMHLNAATIEKEWA